MRGLIALFLFLTVGCGEAASKSKSTGNSSSTNNQTTPTNNSTNLSNEVRLKVTGAQQVSTSSYAISINITNGLDDSISISPAFFRLGVDGLELTSVNLLDSTCPSDALVSSGASFECTLYFDDVDGVPDRLIYAGTGTNIVAEFVPEACETCGTGSCVDLRTSREHCGTCGNALTDDETCNAGVAECAGRIEEGVCIPEESEIRRLPLDSGRSCYDVCSTVTCSGVIAGECPNASDQATIYPGVPLCEASETTVSEIFADTCPNLVILCACG